MFSFTLCTLLQRHVWSPPTHTHTQSLLWLSLHSYFRLYLVCDPKHEQCTLTLRLEALSQEQGNMFYVKTVIHCPICLLNLNNPLGDSPTRVGMHPRCRSICSWFAGPDGLGSLVNAQIWSVCKAWRIQQSGSLPTSQLICSTFRQILRWIMDACKRKNAKSFPTFRLKLCIQCLPEKLAKIGACWHLKNNKLY